MRFLSWWTSLSLIFVHEVRLSLYFPLLSVKVSIPSLCSSSPPSPLFPSFAADSPEVQKQAQERFAAHVENPKEGKALPSEYAVPVYKIVLKAGGQQEFDQVGVRACVRPRACFFVCFLSPGCCGVDIAAW